MKDSDREYHNHLPLSDHSQVVLDALVVDVLVLLKVGHLDLAGRVGGSLRKGAERSLDGGGLCRWKKKKGSVSAQRCSDVISGCCTDDEKASRCHSTQK